MFLYLYLCLCFSLKINKLQKKKQKKTLTDWTAALSMYWSLIPKDLKKVMDYWSVEIMNPDVTPQKMSLDISVSTKFKMKKR